MIKVNAKTLTDFGIELLGRQSIWLAEGSSLEEFCSLKFASFEGPISLGAWSYAVSGFIGNATIGRYCSFGEDVQIGRQSHPIDLVSTSPTFYRKVSEVSRTPQSEQIETTPFIRVGLHQAQRTVIEHDVYVGHGAIILPGVRISTGVVVGAGSVVTKDLEPYSVYAGNPARFIRHRFDKEERLKLLESEWWTRMPDEIDLSLADNPIEFVSSLSPKQRYFRRLEISKVAGKQH